MGTAVFVTRWWTWPLFHNGIRRLQIQNVSPLPPYQPNFHLLTSPTDPHFYYILIWCNLTVLYLLAFMLYYVQYKTLFELNDTYAPIYLPPTQTMPAPSEMQFLSFIFKSKPLWQYIYGTQMLLLMVIFKSVSIYFTKFDTFGNDKYISHIKYR